MAKPNPESSRPKAEPRSNTSDKDGKNFSFKAMPQHDNKDLREDVDTLFTRSWNRLKQAWAWYRSLAWYYQILLGMVILPVAAFLVMLKILLAPFWPLIALGLVAALKFSFLVTKIAFYGGYIGYKILKTLLIWYYIISRSITGYKAKRTRKVMAATSGCPVTDETGAPITNVKLENKHKTLYIITPDGKCTRVLFSYLRIALRGQIQMLQNLWRDKRLVLTFIGQTAQRLTVGRAVTTHGGERLKVVMANAANALFYPHKLNDDVTKSRVLVPGDAELMAIRLNTDGTQELTFSIRCEEFKVTFHKSWKFISVKRHISFTARTITIPA